VQHIGDEVNAAMILERADFVKPRGGVLQWIETLRLYPPFYPPMEFFGRDLSVGEITRFSQFT